MKLLVIGNGGTAVDEDGAKYVNQHTAKLLGDLAKKKYKVRFMQPRSDFIQNGNLQDYRYSQDSRELDVLPSGSVRQLIRALLKVIRNIRESDFTYIFSPGNLGFFAALICYVSGKPYGIYLRGDPGRGRFKKIKCFIIDRAEFVISVSAYFKNEYGFCRAPYVRIRPMVDISQKDVFFRDYSGRDDSPWRLLFVGRLEPSKGLLDLMKAISIMFSKDFQFCLDIVGGGPLLPDLQKMANEYPVGTINVKGMISDREELSRLYEKSDVFVLPTHHEGFPRVLYEAMIKSMAIVTTSVGGIPELMVQGKNCETVPVGDPESIAAAIVALCSEPWRMQSLAEEAKDTAISVLDSFPDHVSAFQEVIDAKG